MSGRSSGTTFNQTGQTVGSQANVGTLTGNLAVGAQTSQADMGKTIATLKAEIASLQGLSPDIRRQLDDALDSAAGVAPSPERGEIKKKLDHAGNALAGAAAQLDGADDMAQKALKLAKTVFSIGKWVIGAFAL
jgi:hypothetical protein